MKRILAVMFLISLFCYAADTAWALGAKPDDKKVNASSTIVQSKTVSTSTANKVKDPKADSLKLKPAKLPRMVDLGASKCIPCKMMAPILEELEKEYKGKMDVVFIDVWKNPDEGSKYKVRVIPTQIFYSPEGKELFRHEGFYSKEDILAKWKELGYQLKK